MGKELAVKSVALTHGGVDVLFDDQRMVSLNDVWAAFGSIEGRDPRRWLRLDSTESFVAYLATTLNVQKVDIKKTVRGRRGGGSWGHWKLAVAYAEYVSEEAHSCVIQAFKEWSEEKNDPALKAERAIKGFRRAGYSYEWIEQRFSGIVTRKALTSTMADHNAVKRGTHDNPFAEGTRSISLGATGKTPKEFKESKGLSRSAKTRNYHTTEELKSIEWAEMMARRIMIDEAADGNDECVDACRRAARAVKLAREALARPA